MICEDCGLEPCFCDEDIWELFHLYAVALRAGLWLPEILDPEHPTHEVSRKLLDLIDSKARAYGPLFPGWGKGIPGGQK